MKKNTFSLPLYSANIKMFFDKKKFEKHHEKHIGPVDLNCAGCVNHYHNKNGYLIVMIGVFENNTGYLAHETVHACSRVFLKHGILYDTENDEPYAYLFEYIFLEANERLYKHYAGLKNA